MMLARAIRTRGERNALRCSEQFRNQEFENKLVSRGASRFFQPENIQLEVKSNGGWDWRRCRQLLVSAFR